ERWVTLVAAVDTEAVRKEQAAQTGGDLGLPAALPGDRGGVAATKAAPPAQGEAPAVPRPAHGNIRAHNVPNTPTPFGHAPVGFLSSYVPAEDPKELERLRFAARTGNAADKKLKEAVAKAVPGVHWLRYDLRTGRLIEPSVVLGPVKAFMPSGVFDANALPLA